LKETSEYIEIHSLKEECPSCGSLLAKSLKRRPLEPRIKIPPPTIQRASALLRLRFDIPKIDSFIGLGSADMCCITGYHSNLILTRLCIRSLLPERYGGLNSPYTLIADAGNRTDVYRAVNFARQYGLNKEKVGDRILVIRAFTVSQVLKLLSVELPKLIRKYQIKSVVIPGLLNTIYEEPSMKAKEAKREIGKMMKAATELSSRVLVVTTIQQEGKYADWVLTEFKKRINLVNEKDGRITAELNNHGSIKTVSLVEQDLKIVH
jgi:hypothetical protein